MSQPDYPLPLLPSYELYQLAHIATFLADRISRHHMATSTAERVTAVHDIGAGRAALNRALASPGQDATPSPIDLRTFDAARGLVPSGPRWAHVVSLAPVGEPGWAVVGNVPGVGPVGARTLSRPVADAVQHHVMTQPAAELGAWAITDMPVEVPASPPQVDLAAVVRDLDPTRDRDRAVARQLRGIDPQLDGAIGARFAGIDLDAPLVVRPPAPQAGPAARPSPRPRGRAAAAGPRSGPEPQAAARSVPSAPAINAGP